MTVTLPLTKENWDTYVKDAQAIGDKYGFDLRLGEIPEKVGKLIGDTEGCDAYISKGLLDIAGGDLGEFTVRKLLAATNSVLYRIKTKSYSWLELRVTLVSDNNEYWKYRVEKLPE